MNLLRYVLRFHVSYLNNPTLVEPRLMTIYAADSADALKRLGLRPADTGADVMIGQPFDRVVFYRTEFDSGISYAWVTQVAVDLMTEPGRGPAEGEGIIEWMELNEDLWRLPPMKII